MKYLDRSKGFSLIELMIVVTIVGVLAAIALPSYRNHLLRTNRTEAKSTLLNVQVAQEKFFLQNNRYAQTTAELSNLPPAGLGIPLTTPSGRYAIDFLGAPTNTTYTIQATAQGDQADDTDCPLYTISESGAKTPAASTGCWK
jgi:type IV pilus assembly protein PilE